MYAQSKRRQQKSKLFVRQQRLPRPNPGSVNRSLRCRTHRVTKRRVTHRLCDNKLTRRLLSDDSNHTMRFTAVDRRTRVARDTRSGDSRDSNHQIHKESKHRSSTGRIALYSPISMSWFQEP